MYDYQRFVSYIYAYEDEVKCKNTGFAKAEVRNGVCKINCNLKGAYGAGNERLDVSCFYEEQGILHKVFLGSFSLRNGAGEFRYIGEEMRLDAFQGIVIQGQENKRKLYLSMWADSEISVCEFFEDKQVVLQETKPADCLIENLQVAEVTFAEVPREEIVEVVKELPVVGETIEEMMEERMVEEHPNWFFEERKGTPWEKLRVRFPKVALHYVEDPIEVLRIEPQDIGLLPRENWIFGNNSFLLHGYYNYRHLILAKRGDSFLLGVPGNYVGNERFLARMFGFESYLSNGENGYWYTEIKIGNNGSDEQKKTTEWVSKMNVSEITYYQVPDFSPKEFARKLSSLIVEVRKEKKKESVVFLCIGSDRSTGDSLGPITGYLLQKNGCFNTVLGTLKEPVHAINLEEALTQIETEHHDSVVVAIDASIGKREHVGSITLGKGAIKPGLGVKKDLSEVGDIFITGIVGASGRFEPLLLQNTRLSMVMGLAECIYAGILLSNTFAELVP